MDLTTIANVVTEATVAAEAEAAPASADAIFWQGPRSWLGHHRCWYQHWYDR